MRRAGQHPVRARREQFVGPAIAGLLDDVLTGVAHDNHVLHVVLYRGEFARQRSAQLRAESRRQRGRLRQGAPQFAHHIGAFQSDFTGQGRAYPAFEPGPGFAEIEARQHRGQAPQGGRARDVVIQRGVCVSLLVRDDLGVAVAAVGGHQHASAGIVNAIGERLGRESAENRRVNQPQALGRLRVENLLGDIGQVEGDARAALQAQRFQRLGAAHRFDQQLAISDLANLDGAAPPLVARRVPAVAFEDDRRARPAAREHVAVYFVKTGVGLCAAKPAVERRAAGVQRLRPGAPAAAVARSVFGGDACVVLIILAAFTALATLSGLVTLAKKAAPFAVFAEGDPLAAVEPVQLARGNVAVIGAGIAQRASAVLALIGGAAQTAPTLHFIEHPWTLDLWRYQNIRCACPALIM